MNKKVTVNRKVIDQTASLIGLLLAVVLLVAGGLLSWGYNFANDQVKSQLVAQKIFFPAAGTGGLTSLPAADQNQMAKYAGEQLLTGKQAQVFADHYIAVHLNKIGGGQTYSQASAASQAAPTDTALAGTVQTLFRGETLRATLLTAYAFWQLGQIAMYSAWFTYIGGILFLLLALLGFAHARKVAGELEV
jgi:spore germination protein GerM